VLWQPCARRPTNSRPAVTRAPRSPPLFRVRGPLVVTLLHFCRPKKVILHFLAHSRTSERGRVVTGTCLRTGEAAGLRLAARQSSSCCGEHGRMACMASDLPRHVPADPASPSFQSRHRFLAVSSLEPYTNHVLFLGNRPRRTYSVGTGRGLRSC
jgi:hypothetical protein